MTVCQIFFKLKFSKFIQNFRTLNVFGKFLLIVKSRLSIYMMGVFVSLLQTHLLKRGLGTETYPQTLLSRFYFLQTITDIRNHDSWNSIEWLLLQPTVSYARLVCKIFCIANITTVDEWFICRKNIFTFQISSHVETRNHHHHHSMNFETPPAPTTKFGFLLPSKFPLWSQIYDLERQRQSSA